MIEPPHDLKQEPTPGLMIALGTINFIWAQLDAIVSGALYSLMSVDPVEFGVIVGRLETQAKVGKMLKILRHRRDKPRIAVVISMKGELEELRPLRNAVTHGYYLGHTASDEYLWTLTADHIISEAAASANELFVAEPNDLASHGLRVGALATEILAAT